MQVRSWKPGTILCLSVLSLGLGGCPTAGVPAGDNTNVNDNVVNNANDNATDNTNDNTADNTNVNDNVVDNSNDNGGTDTTNFAVFVDPDTDFSTTDVRDVDEEMIRFDTTTLGILWVADGRTFDEGFWPVDDVFLGSGGSFQVRFGTKDGERRAYFTETGPATICNFVVSGSSFLIFATSTLVPQE